MNPADKTDLEGLCVDVHRGLKADGVLILVLQDGRAEIVASLQEEDKDLAGKIRRLADEVESGGGMPLGNHLATVSGETTIVGVCRRCGCTEERACFDQHLDGPCCWAEPDLCSACLTHNEFATFLSDAEDKRGRIILP